MAMKTISLAVALAAALLATSVSGKPQAGPPACSASDLGGGAVLACAGYFEGNYISGKAADQAFTAAQLADLGGPVTGSWVEKIEALDGVSTIDFATPLRGITFIGIHKGGAGQGRQGTAWYKVDAGAGLAALDYRLGGSSNAAIYSTGAVPEPEIWALMLAGLLAVVFMSHRRRD